MIELRIFEKKKTFVKTNGDEVVDLTRRSVTFAGVLGNQGRGYIVEDGVEMRGDLISSAIYQTVNMLCLLFKYNGISNPFSINVGDVLKAPDSSTLSSMLTDPYKINGSDDNWKTSTRKSKKSTDIKPKTKQDSKRIEFLQKTSVGQVAPPNVAKDNSVKVVNGKIVFGTDVTSIKKGDCPDPISRTKLQAALTKNKISN